MSAVIRSLNLEELGERCSTALEELFPICRSISGDGVRTTLDILARDLPLASHEVPTGTKVLDWEIPHEWNVRSAWIDGPDRQRVLDFADSNLHVVSYSVPVRARMALEQLQPYLHSLPDHPQWIPYRTSYYEENWGFCLPHDTRERLLEGEYDVSIETTLEPGSLTYGEVVLPGRSEEEVLFSSHVCHPSLANDNLSGVVVAAALASLLVAADLRFTYRFVFAPGTIGAIAWLARNRDRLALIRAGVVLTGVGDRGPLTYKRSRRGASLIDRAAVVALRDSDLPFDTRDFTPLGYDERQYCSPGFNLPVGCLMRTPWGEYPEYHTSGDDLSFVSSEQLALAVTATLGVIRLLEGNAQPVNAAPYGEPQLGKHDLLDRDERGEWIPAAVYQWILSLSDGRHDLIDIANDSGIPFERIRAGADRLAAVGLLHEDSPS